MVIRAIQTNDAPQAIGPYSQGIVLDSAQSILFCSGQIGLDTKSQTMVQGGIEAETHQVLSNLRAVVTSAGMSMSDIVKTTIYLIDLNDFSRVNSIYATVFDQPFPARSTVQVSALPRGARVEIDAIAMKR